MAGRTQFGAGLPYATGPDVLFVAYYASAELGCYRVLGWPMPERILDLFAEFRNRTNGLPTPAGAGLLGALTYFGLDAMGAAEKKEMQEAIGNGTWRGRFTPEEILDYCEADVDALVRLLPAMLPRHRPAAGACCAGRYMAAAAAMEHNGTPIDVETLARLREGWTGIQDDLIRRHRCATASTTAGPSSPNGGRSLLAAMGIPWPLLESGQLDLSDDTFRQMAKSYPRVSPYRELRSSLADLRLNDLAVGSDGRNRTILSAFRSRTGRNQPSNTRFIFGPSVWLRGLIKPPPGYGVAYVDWQTAGIRHRRCLVWRRGDAGGLPDPAIPISPSPSRPAPSPPTPPRRRTGPSASCSSNACWRVQYGMEAEEPRPAHWTTAHRRARSAAGAPRHLPDVLALVGCGRRHRHAHRLAAHRVRVACACR